MSTEPILLSDHGTYASITLNLPGSGNALNRAALLALQGVLRQCTGRYPVAILTGAGHAFCTGCDAGAEAADGAMEYARQGDAWNETIEMMRRHPTVFIAAVNGAALGGGLSLVNVCDLAIASEDAEIGLPEIASGTYPATGGPTTQLRILRKHASWLILTGQNINGTTAAKWGLINRAVPQAALMAEAHEGAKRIAAFNPITLDWTKKALDDIPGQISDWTAALEYGRCITSVIQNKVGKENVTPKGF